MLRKAIAAILCIAFVSSFASCGKEINVNTSDTESTAKGSYSSDNNTSSSESPAQTIADAVNYTAPEIGDKVIIMDIKDYGEIRIRLFPEYASRAVENFIGLAEKGYYDGTIFHRVIDDFMIQGGDPTGTGAGGESYWGGTFDGGTDPHLIHCTGALAYANGGSPSADDSQFFIVTGEVCTDQYLDNIEAYYGKTMFTDANREIYTTHGGYPTLDGNYTVFGQVYQGLDIVFKIQKRAVNSNNRPYEDIIVNSVRVAEYEGEELKFYTSDYDMSSIKKEVVPVMNFTAPEEGDTIIEMNIKDYGTVKLRLFPEYADKAAENFIGLAEKGYYDGTTFHRVINEFMIQGGDPTGTGGGGESIWGGKFEGGTDPHLIHCAGALSCANSGSTATNGSQFFIVTGKEIDDSYFEWLESNYGISVSDEAKEIYKAQGGYPSLDGNYTVFGQVIDGLDIVFEIEKVDTNDSDRPLDDVVVESVKVGEYDGSEIRWHLSDYD